MDEIDQIIQSLEPQLGEPEKRPMPLEGGITNRNYRARFGDRDCVIRVPGKDTSLLEIDRRSERLASELAARLGIAPPVVAWLDDPPCLVTEFVEGRQMSEADLREPDAIRSVAGALRRLHDSGAELPSAFSAFRIGEAYAVLARERGAAVPEAAGRAAELAARIEPALAGAEHKPMPCHDDLLAANFIGTPDGIRIVDWEYAGMGDRYFDLANFAVNNELGEDGEEALLEAYWGEPPTVPRLASLRLMRLMSDYREAMWGVVQSAVSDLDFDFRAYADEHFDRLLAAAEGSPLDRWLGEAE